MDWWPDLELVDGEVSVRPYRASDTDDLFAAATESIADVAPWLAWCHPGYERWESEEWVQGQPDRWTSGIAYDFAVRANDRFVGGCGLNLLQAQNRMANLGYWVRSTAQGRGVATAAARLVAAFGLRELGLERIEIVVAVANRASLRVAEKMGALREGILRRRLLIRDVSHDAVMFSLVSGEFVDVAST